MNEDYATTQPPNGEAVQIDEPDCEIAEDPGAELREAIARADENYKKFLLASADFENYKKRMERSVFDQVSFGHRKILRAFLPVLDNLERALAFEDKSEGLRGGLAQTLKGFENVFTLEGVKTFSVKGAPFDPNVAEAIGTQKADGVEDDTVLEEVEKGYKIGEDLLRPAKVIVVKNGD